MSSNLDEPAEPTWDLQPAERMAGWIAGDLATPPAWRAFGMRPLAAAPDGVEAAMAITPAVLLDGELTPGVLGMLADMVLGLAATMSAAGTVPFVTSTIRIDLTAERLPVSGELLGYAGVAGSVDTRRLLMGEITEAGGGSVAKVSGWFVQVPSRQRFGVPGDYVPPPAGDLMELLGQPVIESASDGSSVLRVRLAPHTKNHFEGLHGGVAVLLSELAARLALSAACGGRTPTTVSLASSYLRTTSDAAGPIAVTGRVRKAGRTTSAAEAIVHAPDGSEAVVTAIDAAG